MEIRLLADHRGDLVQERTRVQNRFRWHLLELCPELESSLKRGSLAEPRQFDRIADACDACPRAVASGSRANRSRRSAA
jgi:hypothetical protein